MTKAFNQLQFNEIITYIRSMPVDGVPIRVEKVYAKRIMHENLGVISGGNVFHFNLKNLGLGIYSVTKAPLSQKDTLLIK